VENLVAEKIRHFEPRLEDVRVECLQPLGDSLRLQLDARLARDPVACKVYQDPTSHRFHVEKGQLS
jgi:predicted component of type VI protein secretion system